MSKEKIAKFDFMTIYCLHNARKKALNAQSNREESSHTEQYKIAVLHGYQMLSTLNIIEECSL